MKKILSIDGGGIRGIIPSMILSDIEKKVGKPVGECFDLIAGTSTGGILALGLSKSNADGKPMYSAGKLAEIYSKRGREIFSRSFWKGVSSVGGLTDELYPADGLERLLDEYFGSDVLGDCLVNTIVTSYDIQNRAPVFLKSWRKKHSNVLMKDAARATSAAPTYFEPALVNIEGEDKALIDGGVFINSPSVSAFAEAIRIFPKETDFFVLSLGTGKQTRPITYKEAKNWGKAEWMLPVMSCMFDGVSDAADYQMKKLLGKSYIRLQTDLTIASDDMDNASNGNVENLKQEAERLILKHKKELNRLYKIL